MNNPILLGTAHNDKYNKLKINKGIPILRTNDPSNKIRFIGIDNDHNINHHSNIDNTKNTDNYMIIRSQKYNCQLMPLLHHQRDIIYVSGKSGSGKSSICASYIKIYNELFPNYKIYLISHKKNDICFRDLNIIHIPLEYNLLNSLNSYHFKNSLVLFDDFEHFNGNLGDSIYNLLNDLLFNGRSLGVTVLICTHLIANGKKTKSFLSECTHLTLFPNFMSKKNFYYILHDYVGFDNNIINSLYNTSERWISIYMRMPRLIFCKSGAFCI